MNMRLNPSWFLGGKSHLLSVLGSELDLRRHFFRHVRVEIFDCHFPPPVNVLFSDPFPALTWCVPFRRAHAYARPTQALREYSATITPKLRPVVFAAAAASARTSSKPVEV
jgi:hypothetical protein